MKNKKNRRIKKIKSNKNFSKKSKKQTSRQANSLEEITKKFINCVIEADSNTIDLNTVMKKIKVKKRRIYDITNVMEGKNIIYIIFK